jgi:sensor histidine kinase YesM
MSKKLNFRSKVYLSYIILLGLFFLIVIPAFFTYLDRSLRARELDNLNALCEKTVAQLDDQIQQLNSLSIYISTNPHIRNLLGGSLGKMSPSQINDFTGMLLAMHVPSSSARQRISIYDNNGFYKSTGLGVEQSAVTEYLTSQDFETMYDDLEFLSSYIVRSPHQDDWSNSDKYMPVSLYRNLIDPSTFTRVGVVEIQMANEDLISMIDLQTSGIKQIHSILLDQDGLAIYIPNLFDNQYSDPELLKIHQSHMDNKNAVASSGQVEGISSNLIVAATSKMTGWTYCLVMPRNVLWQSMLGPYIGFSVITLIILLIMLVLTYVISKKLTKPLLSLNEQIRGVTLQNLSINLPAVDEQDEINQLNDAFYNMFGRLKDSMNQVTMAQTRELQAHIAALQGQIDPHFIYNVLSIIAAYSRDSGLKKIEEIIGKLSAILRYATNHDQKPVALQDEINHVNNYLSLMKMRYEDQFDYTIRMSDEIQKKEIFLPRLSLQPLVENSFSHGFKHVLPPWAISIDISVENDKWVISISDNGIGMTNDQIDNLRRSLTEMVSNPTESIRNLRIGGMGLINTLARLQFTSNSGQFDYKILSKEEGHNGFCIIIKGDIK